MNARFMRDRDGLVHELYPGRWNGVDIAWYWLTGHVDARTRVATPAPDATAATCLACIRAWEKLPEHMRTAALEINQGFVR